MNKISLKKATVICASALVAFSAGIAQASTLNHAENVYAEYSAGTNGKVLFEIETLANGPLTDFADKTFGDILQPAAHRIDAETAGIDIAQARYTVPNKQSYGAHDLAIAVKDFEQAGYPLAMGQYRILGVGTAIGDDIRYHQALEACWQQLGHCVVLDPTVVFLESVVNNRLRLRAEGWGPRVTYSYDGLPFQGKATCGLASNPASTNRVTTWSARSLSYKDILGITLVTKSLGGQQAGFRCNTSCVPAPYGYSYTSSCSATLGYNCACGNKYGTGVTNKTGKWIAETKCTHRLTLAAKASASLVNVGSASVDINWDLAGGVDSSGGFTADTCGYF